MNDFFHINGKEDEDIQLRTLERFLNEMPIN